MKKSRINILIVEDDITQGKALYEAVTREGYNATLCNSSVSAITMAQRHEFQCLMVDCLLPKMNGIDLIEEILKIIPNRPKVFLFTGIFKDREFTREALKKTGADMFFLKPLDLPAILSHFETTFANLDTGDSTPVLRLYSSETFADEAMEKLIERESTIHAFHLPMLYQRIHDTTLSGELTMISAEGDVSSVTFFRGNVCQVKTPDKESYFGSLAVSKGFVSPQEVIEALNDSRAGALGTKLVESMSLSPHAIDVIVEEQMALRLSQTIRDDVVSLQWVAKKLPKPPNVLDDSRFENMIEDWLESKITNEWISSTLMSWGDFKIEGNYHSRVRGHKLIREVLSDEQFSDEKDHHEVFNSLIRGSAFVGVRSEDAPDFSFLESRLDKMANDFKHQNFFQILGLSEKAATREVTKSYEGLKEAFDPRNLPPECPDELRVKCERIFSVIERARETLSDDVERLRYLQNLQTRRNAHLLEAEPIFRTAIIELSSGHPKEAAKKFQTLLDRKLEFKDLKAYRIWAGLKSERDYSALRLDQIPPEERHSAPYMVAKGISYRQRGHYKKAIEALRTAHMLDPRMRAARTELKIVGQELEKNRGQHKELIRDLIQILEAMASGTRTMRIKLSS